MILAVNKVKKSFSTPTGKDLTILKNIELAAELGETIAVCGQSGSGKSTLLSLLGGLDAPTEGQVLIDNQDLAKLNQNTLAKFRARRIGFVFQQFFLMPHLTAIENISLPLEILMDEQAQQQAQQALQNVGLEHRKNHFPAQLSGGEMQRVAIARALVSKPKLMLADEPTGNLDQEIGHNVADLLFNLAKDQTTTLILVTHNQELAQRCQRILTLKNGLLV